MRIISACLVLFLITFLLVPKPAFAHSEYSLPQAGGGQVAEALAGTVPLRFLPSHPLYFLILIKENINRIFQPSAVKRAEFDLVVAGKRVKETYLLIDKGDSKNAAKSIRRYSQRMKKMVKQINKARSQNQEVEPQVMQMAESLRLHEILLSTTNTKWQLIEDKDNFDEYFSGGIAAFSETILALDDVKPGIKDRFKTITTAGESAEKEASPTPSGADLPQATSSAAPRRIIY